MVLNLLWNKEVTTYEIYGYVKEALLWGIIATIYMSFDLYLLSNFATNQRSQIIPVEIGRWSNMGKFWSSTGTVY